MANNHLGRTQNVISIGLTIALLFALAAAGFAWWRLNQLQNQNELARAEAGVNPTGMNPATRSDVYLGQ